MFNKIYLHNLFTNRLAFTWKAVDFYNTQVLKKAMTAMPRDVDVLYLGYSQVHRWDFQEVFRFQDFGRCVKCGGGSLPTGNIR